MKSSALLLLIFVLSPVFAATFSNCGTSSDIFRVSSVTLTPDPPAKGQNVTVSLSGTLSSQVQSGTLTMQVRLAGVTLFTKDVPLCAPEEGITCPIRAGAFTKKVTQFIPTTAPAGSYTLRVTTVNQANTQLECVSVSVRL